jgi:hypothetical protein
MIIEYVLLIFVAVTIAVTMTRLLVARGPDVDDTGLLIQNWMELSVDIGNDQADIPR